MVLPEPPSRSFSLDYLRFTLNSLKTIASNRNRNESSTLRVPRSRLLLTTSGKIPKTPSGTASRLFDDEGLIYSGSSYKDFETLLEEFENQLTRIQPTLDVLLLSIDLNVNCVCSSIVFDVTILECGHMFCRNCIKTWTTSHKRRCPYCRVMTNEAFNSEQIELLLAELELIQLRHVRFSRMIEYPLEDTTTANFPDSSIMSESRSSVTFKCWKIDSYLSMTKYLLSTENGSGERLGEKYFPASLHTHRLAQVKYNRRKDFCWPWSNENFRRDIMVTVGLYVVTFLQLCMFSAQHGQISDWSWTEFVAAGFIYVWSAMCVTYFIMLVR